MSVATRDLRDIEFDVVKDREQLWFTILVAMLRKAGGSVEISAHDFSSATFRKVDIVIEPRMKTADVLITVREYEK